MDFLTDFIVVKLLLVVPTFEVSGRQSSFGKSYQSAVISIDYFSLLIYKFSNNFFCLILDFRRSFHILSFWDDKFLVCIFF